MDNREYEYGEMVDFMSIMKNAMDAYERKEYENALHNALKGLDNAVNVYLSIVNDYPYNERQFEFARELKRMIDSEHTKIEIDFDNGDTAENE
jgi:hypothetical protein